MPSPKPSSTLWLAVEFDQAGIAHAVANCSADGVSSPLELDDTDRHLLAMLLVHHDLVTAPSRTFQHMARAVDGMVLLIAQEAAE